MNDYGYGVRLDDLAVNDSQKIREFVKKHCTSNLKNHVIPCKDDVRTMLDYAGECGNWSGSGLAEILADAVENEHYIHLVPIVGVLADEYCLYQSHFPWEKQYKKDIDLTEQKIEEILASYLSELTDSTPKFDYYEVIQTI